MIGLARCIAMVIVWNELARGDNEYAAGLVAFNSVFQVLFYSIYAWVFITDLAAVVWPARQRSCRSASGKSPKASYLSGYSIPCRECSRASLLIKAKGKDWYRRRFIPKISPVTLLPCCSQSW